MALSLLLRRRAQNGESAQLAQQSNDELQLHILEQDGDHSRSMKLLSENGLRPLTYQEALARSSELTAKLRGRWFYLDGQGIFKEGIRTFNSKGELGKFNGRGPADQKVQVSPGNRPLSLLVAFDGDFKIYGRRFLLFGDQPPEGVAPSVVGVQDPEAMARLTIAKGGAALRRLQRNSPG